MTTRTRAKRPKPATTRSRARRPRPATAPERGTRAPVRQRALIALSQDDLRLVGRWAAACATRALPLYEARAPGDKRPRQAIEGAEAFARGADRTAKLRSLGWAAFKAAREVGDPAAAAAARAACLAAAVAYTHPLADRHQTKHVVGPAAYLALARELATGDPRAGEREVRWAIGRAPRGVRAILRRMVAVGAGAGAGRVAALLHQVDAGLRRGARR